ncbi:glycosyltransferase [Thiorhodococcus mannitoliphagus]|uniref:Glycosyltransferase n=1 Tax=Thiorhodococcus mannitoliphagus TaxID=329406 RepID=A0A6P1DW99_9GAMM|nr:glycosyltransferase [Thiorhodococcus mannitoliphagus]NEX22428.1 glycosyltransferase [Thiorhodococcus mannitoliphagus]
MGIDPHRIACFFSTSGHSGVDRAAKHLIPALARRGYQVDLLKVRRHGPNLPEIPEAVRVIDLGSRHTLACLPAVARYLRSARPAAMLSDKDRVNRVALFARALARVPTRLVLRSGTTISIDLATRGALERWVQRNSMGRLYPFADQVIVACQGVADDLAAYTGLARERIRVVPPPVIPEDLLEAELPRPDHPWFAQADKPLILSAGELCSRKDFETLIRAFARLRSERPCRLMIVGRGGARERLLALARELEVAEDVALPGYVDNPYAYMAHADLFAFTSRWEGLGFVLIEALAVGTPVVSTDCPSGPSEILEGGRYGPLVPVGDDVALAAAMAATLEDPLPAAQLKQAARRYEIEASTDVYLDALGLAPQPMRGSAAPARLEPLRPVDRGEAPLPPEP